MFNHSATIKSTLILLLASATLAACEGSSSSPTAHSLSAASPPVPRFHRMPCPAHLAPDRIAVSWRISQIGKQLRHGTLTVIQPGQVQHLYRQICAVTLEKYDHPFVCACPATDSDSVYHLAFLRGRRALLRITESVFGETTLTIDTRPDLGFATIWFLPKGVPPPPV